MLICYTFRLQIHFVFSIIESSTDVSMKTLRMYFVSKSALQGGKMALRIPTIHILAIHRFGDHKLGFYRSIEIIGTLYKLLRPRVLLIR